MVTSPADNDLPATGSGPANPLWRRNALGAWFAAACVWLGMAGGAMLALPAGAQSPVLLNINNSTYPSACSVANYQALGIPGLTGSEPISEFAPAFNVPLTSPMTFINGGQVIYIDNLDNGGTWAKRTGAGPTTLPSRSVQSPKTITWAWSFSVSEFRINRQSENSCWPAMIRFQAAPSISTAACCVTGPRRTRRAPVGDHRKIRFELLSGKNSWNAVPELPPALRDQSISTWPASSGLGLATVSPSGALDVMGRPPPSARPSRPSATQTKLRRPELVQPGVRPRGSAPAPSVERTAGASARGVIAAPGLRSGRARPRSLP